MIVATVHYRITPGSLEKVSELSAGIRDFALGCKGNVDYAPMASPYEENVMVSTERWESLDAMKAYCDSQECIAFQNARNEFLVPGTMEAHVYEGEEVSLACVMQR